MQGGWISYALLACLATALVFAAITDIQRRQIDNWLTAGIALSAPLFWIATGLGWEAVLWHLGIATATFAVLAALFALGQMGGGDVKLLTALALWIQPLWFTRLIIVMAIVGGLLTLGFALHHKLRKSEDRLAVPYGVAISIAGLWTLARQYFGEDFAGPMLG